MALTALITAQQLVTRNDLLVIDCRYALTDPDAGYRQYEAGHIVGAHYLDLARHLSGAKRLHGGRHPLPQPQDLAQTLAALGVGQQTEVVVYDDSRFAFAARLWWLMRSLGYRPPQLLDGGYQAYLDAGGELSLEVSQPRPCKVPAVNSYTGSCDRDGLLQAQTRNALLVDSREALRYQGLEEPIDPVAGHIPGAINRPWQGVTQDTGGIHSDADLRLHWAEAEQAQELVVYCGSGVTACVNLLSLSILGREDAVLYAGSWSDWCSHL